MNHANFDERNWESWYFGLIPHQEVEDLLRNEEPGTFLLRASSTAPDTFVICVKEVTGVANYQVKTATEDGKVVFKIRDDWSFSDMPSLLSFYKRNLFKSTSLVKPVSDVTHRAHSNGPDMLIQRYSENLSATTTPSASARTLRMSAPADCRMRHSRDESLPLYYRVIKEWNPSPYAKNKLKLTVGDVIRVLRRSGDQWEGELDGKRGSFPFTFVEFIQGPGSTENPPTPTNP